LAEDVALKRDVPRDGKIYLDDIRIPADRPDFTTFALAQEASKSLGR
jgi:hypothetical protein